METSRREHLFGLASLAAASVATSARAQADPFVGTWSATSTDDDGTTQRVKLIIEPGGKASIVLVDEAGISIPATKVELSNPNLHIEWKNVGFDFKAVLKGDSIEGTMTTTLSGEGQAMTFHRGDLFAIDNTVLPPGPMTQERLERLRLIAAVPAMGVAFAFQGGKDHVLAYGLRSLASSLRVGVADKWHIGSCTKAMTATLAARLVEGGHLKWETTIPEALSTRVPHIDPGYGNTNLLHLLNNRAGLPHDLEGEARMGRGARKNIRAERLQYVATALKDPPMFGAGERDSYSNVGFTVAGAMMEAVMGRSWEDLMRATVFAPLGMTGTGFGPPGDVRLLDQPVGHMPGKNGKLRPATKLDQADNPVPVSGPSGTVHASLGDLLAFLKAHRDRPAAFLSEASWRKLHTPPFGGNYALGWVVDKDGTLQHTGSNGFWWTHFSVHPTGMVFASTMNAVTPNSISAMAQAEDAVSRSEAGG